MIDLANTKVFVTGAAGFLGTQLVTLLLERGAEVHALVRSRGSLCEDFGKCGAGASGRLVVHCGDVSRVAEFAFALRDCQVLYHLASSLSGSAAAMFMNNVVNTRRLIDACTAAQVRRLVLVSSLAVYGSQSLKRWGLLDETCPLDKQPHLRDVYTYSKAEQEEAARESCRNAGLSLVTVRPGVIYGPGRDCLSARVGLRVGRTLLRLGGCHPLPYTHVINCAEAVLLAGVVPDIDGEAFNIIDDNMPTARQLARRYRRSVQRIRIVPVPQWSIRPLSLLCEKYHSWSRGQLPAVLTPYKSAAMWKPLQYSNVKAKKWLGWAPTVPAHEGIEETLRTLRRTTTTASQEGN